MNRFLGHIAKDIADHQLLPDGRKILVAVSGGLDSVVLLEALHRLAPRHGWTLIVAHFNHQLRGRESDRDERFTRELASRLGWSFLAGRDDVGRRARSRRISVEMAAREARHAFLAGAAREAGAEVVAHGHHSDDQAELFLVRLLRGAGSEGLGGMRWSGASPADPAVRLVRPLLGRSRAEISAFARDWSLAFREDASNASLDILRNRIRRQLIPQLRKHYQAAIGRVLTRQAELLADEADWVTAEARRWLESPPGERSALDQLPVALQRRVLVEQLLARGIVPNFVTVEALRTRPDVPLRHRRQRVARSVDGIVFDPGAAGPSGSTPKTASASAVPSSITVDWTGGKGRGRVEFGDYRLEWRLRGGRAPNVRQAGPGREWVDADKLGGQIELRTVRPGDRFRPLGMPGPARLSNLLAKAKIPREQRARQLLATTETGEIWWVAGLRLGESARVDADTRRFLEWKWELK